MPIPTDPRFLTSTAENQQQWYLDQRDAGQFDLNVVNAWVDYTGAGINVFVIDSGFDFGHFDLQPNYDQAADHDYEDNDDDASPGSGGLADHNHGTAVMGIIGADSNGQGTVGIAFDARLVGFRTHGLIDDTLLANIRDSITDAADQGADVVNISQGISNLPGDIFGGLLDQSLIAAIRSSIDHAVDTGRGGLGTMIAKLAGNSRDGAIDNYDINADMWANDTRQVVVAAVNQDGFVSQYSSYGAAILVSGFGSALPGEIVTTDRTGTEGYNTNPSPDGDIVNTFAGTSAATAMISGVMSLMLDANEGLGWRDVQDILAYSARHVGSAVRGAIAGFEREASFWNNADNWNGGGLHYSIDYGYGLVDALAGVRMAESWFVGFSARTSANEASTSEDDFTSGPVAIPDNDPTGTTFAVSEDQSIVVDRVRVNISFATDFIGDLEVYLISPNGTQVTLVRDILDGDGSGADGNNFNGTWSFESQSFRGELSNGTWQVRIADDDTGDALTVTNIELQTFGTAVSANDRYVFTNEYSDSDGIAGHRTIITDADGGIDTVNAAAVSSASAIDLNNGKNSFIDGATVKLSNIENAVGGDWADSLTGNGSANLLYGFRGNDRLYGNAGADTLDGGIGADLMRGGASNDTYYVDNSGDIVDEKVTGSTGSDIVRSSTRSINLSDITHFKGSIEKVGLLGTKILNATGNALNNTLIGNSAKNVLSGSSGNDSLSGGLGNDNLKGGTGKDSLNGGLGNDRLAGGSHDDKFVFNTVLGSTNKDTVTDFNKFGNDLFRLDNAVFTKLHTGGLKEGNFHLGSRAADSNDYIVYNKGSGALFYDFNGSGSGGAIQFAYLQNKPTLTIADFVIY